MLDINLLRKDLDSVVARLNKRKSPQPYLDVAAFKALEAERKGLQTRTEELQSQRNQISKQVGMLMGKGDKDGAEAAKAQVAQIKTEFEASSTRLEQIQGELQTMLLAVPNMPHESVPVGSDESGNVEVRRWGTPKTFDFEAKDHVDVGTPLGLDFDMGVKLSGSRFTVMKGPIARLHHRDAEGRVPGRRQYHQLSLEGPFAWSVRNVDVGCGRHARADGYCEANGFQPGDIPMTSGDPLLY